MCSTKENIIRNKERELIVEKLETLKKPYAFGMPTKERFAHNDAIQEAIDAIKGKTKSSKGYTGPR